MSNKKVAILLEDEQILGEANIHYSILLIPGLIFLIGIYLWMTSNNGFTLLSVVSSCAEWIQKTITPLKEYDLVEMIPQSITEVLGKIRFKFKYWISLAVMLWGAIKLYRALVTLFCTSIQVTDHRILIQAGLLNRSTTEIMNEKPVTFNINQGILGRLLSFGKVTIYSTEGIRINIPNVKDPFEIVNINSSGIQNKQKIQENRTQNVSNPFIQPQANNIAVTKNREPNFSNLTHSTKTAPSVNNLDNSNNKDQQRPNNMTATSSPIPHGIPVRNSNQAVKRPEDTEISS